MKLLSKVSQAGIAIVVISLLGACANDPVKAPIAGAKPINYGCSGTSKNDCMTFHAPTGATVQR